MYEVTKQFTGGILKGLVVKEKTTVRMTKGDMVDNPIDGSSYVVVEVKIAS